MNKIINPKHNFLQKITQKSNFSKLQNYISNSISRDKSKNIKNFSPISINLDLTTSCNYACEHCVDMDILNTGIKFELDNLKQSLNILIDRGLKSVIIIGGGEPTVSPYFFDIVKLLKEKNIQIGVVTNGSRPEVIKKSVPLFKKGDWVRYSLDSGSDDLFKKMHLPKKKTVNLNWICENVKEIANINKDVAFGFSFIIVWNDCVTNNLVINENLHEMEMATKLARDSVFSYISFKPFLDREENNSEVIGGGVKSEEINRRIKKKIRENLLSCKKYENENFKIIQSTNLTVFLENLAEKYQNQPKRCHMNYFRQVLSPLGTFACPVYRNVKNAKIGTKNAFEDNMQFEETSKNMVELIDNFDASKICKNVVCLYNEANWEIENRIDKKQHLEDDEFEKIQTDSFL